MKTRIISGLLVMLATASVLAQSFGTAFTYQGQLNSNGVPANGSYNFIFTFYTNATTGTQTGSSVSAPGLLLTNGLFTASLDFGDEFTNATAYWLGISVSTTGNNYTSLEPRQPLTPTPYSIFATTASNLTGTVSASQLNGFLPADQLAGTLPLINLPSTVLTNNESGVTLGGAFSGNGSGLTGLNASQLTSGSVPLGQLPTGIVTNGGNVTFSNVTLNGALSLGNSLLYGGNYNVFAGYDAGGTTTSQDNVAIGASALKNGNTGGGVNVAIGFGALTDCTSGEYNTAIGPYALIGDTGGSYNIGLGFGGGSQITTGDFNIDIGNPGTANDSYIIRIGDGQTATYLSGNVYGNSFNATSDRNAKENFVAVNPETVLDKVAALPITEWNYKTDNSKVRHTGPTAQAFQELFGLNGKDDKHISLVDESGVALAAIQGLNQKLEAQMKDKDAEIAGLKQSVTDLKQLVQSLVEKK